MEEGENRMRERKCNTPGRWDWYKVVASKEQLSKLRQAQKMKSAIGVAVGGLSQSREAEGKGGDIIRRGKVVAGMRISDFTCLPSQSGLEPWSLAADGATPCLQHNVTGTSINVLQQDLASLSFGYCRSLFGDCQIMERRNPDQE